MKKDIFVWEPLLDNNVFKLVKINNRWSADVLPDVLEINIFSDTVEIVKDNDVIDEIEVDDAIWTDVLDELHKFLNGYGFNKEESIHVFPVRLGVFRKYLHYEIVEYNRAYEWTVKFVDGNNVKIDVGNFIEKGYRIVISDNISKLLTSEKISNYRISKDTGIPQSTLSDYAIGKSDISNMKLDHAIKLNEFYLKVKEMI